MPPDLPPPPFTPERLASARVLLRPLCRIFGHRPDATPWVPGGNGYSRVGWKRTVFCRRCGLRESSYARGAGKPLDIIGGRQPQAPADG